MRVQCTYNQEYEIFLKAVVDYVIERWGDELDLSGAETIELVDISEFIMRQMVKYIMKGRIFWLHHDYMMNWMY